MVRLIGLFVTGFAVAGLVRAAPSDVERARIEAAIVRVEKSKLIFVRNGSEYGGAEAASHLRNKLKLAGNSVKTFDDFVEKVASKSSITGRPYLVKFPQGKTEELAKWLDDTPSTQP